MLRHRILLTLASALVPLVSLHADLLHGEPIGSPSVDYATGKVSTTVNLPADAFDGDFNTFYASYARQYTWVGLDLGEPHVITRIAWSPRQGQEERMLLGVFEGANQPDFSDAIPLYIITKEPVHGKYAMATIKCSRGVRYVRYVGPNDSRCNVAELKFWGNPGEGDDSKLCQLTSQPVVSIHTEDARDITSKSTYLNGTIAVISQDGAKLQFDTLLVRGRGNGSWTFPQKPYKLKLAHKHKLLGGPAKAKKWTLINNYRDKTLLRNPISFEASRIMGLPYTPAYHLVDVLLNGEYKGSYMLCDQVQVHKDRVEVTEMTPEDNAVPNVNGGYLIEIDAHAYEEECAFYSKQKNTGVTIKYPDSDDITREQLSYIMQAFNSLESRIFSTSYSSPTIGYRTLLDTESFLKRFLVEEFSGNTDAYYSVFMYKDRDDRKFYTAPVWDLDLTYDNDTRTYPINSMNTYVSLSSGASTVSGMPAWLSRILPDAKDEMQAYWSTARHRGGFTKEHFYAFIDSMTTAIDDHQKLHFMRWPVLDQLLAYNTGIRYTYQAEVDWVKAYIADRLDWLDNKIGLLPDGMTDATTDGARYGRILSAQQAIAVSGFTDGSLVQVVSPDGRIISQHTLTGPVEIAVTPGVYIVRVKTPDNQIITRKTTVR